MTCLGVNFMARKAGNTLKPTLAFSRAADGKHYTIRVASTFKTLPTLEITLALLIH